MAEVVTRSTLPFGRIRRRYWALLVVALLLTLGLPTATLWHAAGSALRLRASVWPAVPHVGEPVHVLVVPLDDADGTATAGAWARLVVNWDMVDMAMHTQPISVPGHPEQSTFTVPLQADMAGVWQVDVRLQTPGRPPWHALLRIVVLPSSLTSSLTSTAAGSGSDATAITTAGRGPAESGRYSA